MFVNGISKRPNPTSLPNCGEGETSFQIREDVNNRITLLTVASTLILTAAALRPACLFGALRRVLIRVFAPHSRICGNHLFWGSFCFQPAEVAKLRWTRAQKKQEGTRL